MKIKFKPHYNQSDSSFKSENSQKFIFSSRSRTDSYGGPPPQAMVDASHADRIAGTDFGGICFFIIVIIFAIATSVAAFMGYIPALWDTFVFPWITVTFIIVGLWQSFYADKHEFMCNVCVYSRCNDRGIDRKLFFCTKWEASPIQFFFPILISGYGIFTTSLLVFSRQIWILIFSTFLSAIFLGMGVLGWVVELNRFFKKDPEPHAYITPPDHSFSCICLGSGICPLCRGTGKIKISNQTQPCSIVCPKEPGIEPKGMEHGGCFACFLILLLLLLYYGIWVSGVFFEYI